MSLLKTSLLWLGSISLSFATETVVIPTVSEPVVPTESAEIPRSDNLIQRNPFVPFKVGKSLAENVDISSDFDFLGVVIYPDHQEFSLKEKNQEKSFWLSSNSKNSDETHGLVFWNFYPTDKTLVVQDSYSGNLINIKQKEFSLGASGTNSSLYSSDWSSFLSDYDDDDDDDILLPKSKKNKSLAKDKK